MSLRAQRSGYTILELTLVIAIISILAAILIPGIASLLDQIDVRGATADARSVFAAARHVAIARASPVTVDIDTAAHTLLVRAGSDTVRWRDEHELHGVRFRATRTSMTYAPTGVGYGVSNLTLIITKRNAADTLVISRLGRVR
jgi:prepilin-type N-terminal cleavage/methylation domain-containing protein